MSSGRPVSMNSEFEKPLENGEFESPRPNGNPETTANFTEQILRLLNQKIQRKIDWEHERLILSHESCSQDGFGQQSLIENSPKEPRQRDDWKIQEEDDFLNLIVEEQIHDKFELKEPEEAIKSSQVEEEIKGKEKTADKKKTKGCTCKKSFCLKMYCQCFRSGKQCIDCGCVGCKNIKGEEELRNKAVRQAKEREPTAFNQNFKYKGCRCTKSQCVKGYCECFMEGHTCGKYCKCVSCKNRLNQKTRKGSDSSTVPDVV